MKKSKRSLAFKLFIAFIIMVCLSIVSFLLLDLKNIAANGYKFGDGRFYINIKDQNANVKIGKNGIHLNAGQNPMLTDNKERYELTSLERLELRASSLDININKSDKNYMEVYTNRDKVNEERGGNFLNVGESGLSYMMVDIWTAEPEKLDLSLVGDYIDLENYTPLKSLSINGSSVDAEVYAENSFAIDVKAIDVDMEVNVNNNNFDVNLDSDYYDFESTMGDGEGMGEFNKKFGSGVDRFIINADNIDLEIY